MAEAIRVFSGYAQIGSLAPNISYFRISQNDKRVPLRFVQYRVAQSNPQAISPLLSWQALRESGIPVPQLGNKQICDFMFPPDNHGALLVHREQIDADINETMRRMVPGLEQYSSWSVLLPRLMYKGKIITAFTLQRSRVRPEEIRAFTLDVHPDILDRIFPQDPLFICIHEQEPLTS